MALPDSGDIARMRRIIARLHSYGVVVREMPGHERRGFRYPAVPIKLVDHHDASSRKSGEWGALGLILDGTPRGIPGPLANFQVPRCLDNVPKVAVVADGYTYHAGTGGPLDGLPKNGANPRTYGVEKANDGLGEPMTAAAEYATNALFHAIAIESGSADPGSFPIGHKEWAVGRKTDPLYSMPERRRRVAAFRPRTAPADLIKESFMAAHIIKAAERDPAVLVDGLFLGLVPGTDEEKNWIAAGAKEVWLTDVSYDAFVRGEVLGMPQRDVVRKLNELIELLRAQTDPGKAA